MKTEKIYLASSWRNPGQPAVVEWLRHEGFEIYDFRNPPNNTGFSWDQVGGTAFSDKENYDNFIAMLNHPVAQEGFNSDFDAMKWADTFILVLPCGKSAHLELGWAIGKGKKTCILSLTKTIEPELMYCLADKIIYESSELLEWLNN